MADLEKYRKQALNNLSKPKEEEPKEEPKKEPQKPASKVEEYRQQALNRFSKPKEISEDTIKNAAKPEPKKTKEVVKEKINPISEEVKSEEVGTEEVSNTTDNNPITEEVSSTTDSTRITSEDEAKKALQDAGVDPNKVDSKEGAEEETSKIVDKLLATGLFEKDKDGKLTYIGINIEPDKKRKAASVLGKIGTAASIIGALATGGAIPPMNLNDFFLNADDTKAYDAKLKQMTDTVNKIIDKAVTKDTIKAQADVQKEQKQMDYEYQIMLKDKDLENALKESNYLLQKEITLKKLDFKNQEDMAKLMAEIQAELPAKTREANILALKSLEQSLGKEDYKEALKTIATAVAAEGGTTPTQLGLTTAGQIVNVATKPIAEILGAVTGGK